MTNNHKLKIGLDYHGLIDINVAFFSRFCTNAKVRGHSVYIITGGPKVMAEHDLAKNNIKHDFVYAISDHYQALKDIDQSINGKLYIPDNLWNRAKAEFCRKNQINIHIDDNMEYLRSFSTPYCYYNKSEHKGIISLGGELDFNHSPIQVLNKIEQVLLL